MSIFKGSCAALITPFNENGVDFDEMHKLIDFQIENGTDALLICGTTGEPSTMTKQERQSVIVDSIKYINKRVPVIVGAGSNATSSAIEKCQFAKEVGADAVLIVTPYYNKATQKGLIAHYNAICDAVDIPVIVYNVPGRTGVNINPDTMSIIADHKNVVGIKEASGNISQIMEVSRLCNGKADLYSGNDDQIVPVLSCGGSGVISVVANIMPKETHNLVDLYLNGKPAKALEIQHKINPFVATLFSEVNPIPVKKAANLLGFNAGSPRLPLTEMDEAKAEIMANEMRKLELI